MAIVREKSIFEMGVIDTSTTDVLLIIIIRAFIRSKRAQNNVIISFIISHFYLHFVLNVAMNHKLYVN